MWREETLADVASWASGGTPRAGTAAYYNGSIPWAVIGDLNDGLVTQTKGSVTEEGLAASAAKIVPEGTVLVAMYGSIGKLGIAGTPMATNQAIATAQAHECIDSKFLFYYLLGQRDALAAAGKGATQRNISQSILKPWPIRYPDSLDDQRRIVTFLEDQLSRLDAAADYIAASRRRLLALERAALDSHFGGREVRLAELIRGISAGKSFGSANAPAEDDQWGIIKVSAMTWGEFDPRENKAVAGDQIDPRFEIHEGDLLVSRANTAEYVGSSVLVGPVRPKLLLSDKSLRITPEADVTAEWLWRALQAPSARRQISGLATGTKDSMRNISQSALQEILLPRADEAMQADALVSFGAIFDANTDLRKELYAAESRLVALRRSLLAAAFGGRVAGSAGDLSDAEEMIGA